MIKIFSSGYRKVSIFVISIVISIVISFVMELAYYQAFLNFLLWLAIGFFAGNGIEHVANKIKAR